MLYALGTMLMLMGLKGMTRNGIWITTEKQLEGPLVKVIGVVVVLAGLGVMAYARFS